MASLLIMAAGVTWGPARAAEQQIALRSGWNLVSIQVGDPGSEIGIEELLRGLDRPGVVRSVWEYRATNRTYVSFQANTNHPSDLFTIRPGRGYWIQLSEDAVLKVSGPLWQGAVSLVPGWNLVGFPAMVEGKAEAIPLETVFRGRFSEFPQVWGYEAGRSSTGGERYVGFDPSSRPAITELKAIEAGRGYWVLSSSSASLEPSPLLALPPDTDLPDATNLLGELEPFQPTDLRWKGTNPAVYLGRQVIFAGPEDVSTDLNQNGILDDPYTQDVFLFDEGVTSQNITILNTNASILNWTLSTRTPWISFSASQGTTTSESDYVLVSVNPTALLAGDYDGGFTADFGSIRREVTVRMRVPAIAGDYRGAATTTRVNGKTVSLGKVDLNFSLFMEGDSREATRFRGVIDRGAALLFPQDVFLDGVLYLGNNFSLTTTFEMPAGNRYEPPFDTATNLFNYNPFPFPIFRQITLQGTRATADRLEGLYVESIAGVVPGNDRITIEGTFTLDRTTLTPTKRTIYNGRSRTIPHPLGGTASAALTNSLAVADAVSVQGVVVTVNTSYPRPELLTLTLVGPGTNGSRVLVRGASNLPPGATFVLTNFNGIIGQGEWRLVVDWNGSSERGQFNGWELNLLGLATYSAAGRIVATNLAPMSGATLTLAGGNIIYQAVTPTNGSFTFPRLTENAYTLNISKPGYRERSVFFRIHRSNVELQDVVLSALTSTGTNLIALPSIGAAPLSVVFSPQIPQAVLASLGTDLVSTWSFGDGTQVVFNDPPSLMEHTYLEGIYVTDAMLIVTGSAGGLTLPAPPIHAMSLSPNTNTAPHQIGRVNAQTNQHFIFGGAFIGSVAAPVENASTNIQSFNTDGPEIGVFYQESKRDAAGFDIDRDRGALPPAFDLHAEDTAFFVQPDSPYSEITQNPRPPGDPGFTPYVPPVGSNSTPKPDRFRIVSTLGATVFGSHPASAGNFLLQTGRIEP